MIVVHHLNNSRSQRILWLLEELNTPYRLETYRRDAKTNLAPPELGAVHPLGKSPVIQDGDLVLAESGAIVEHRAAGAAMNMTPYFDYLREKYAALYRLPVSFGGDSGTLL